ncbi:hypothetical protein [Nocardioides donggukensis]|uniref:Uncharacterized protein n=1 Tax=Nocardioides donggukensis TaxID=2774019 RepID=A0A927PYG1_9ACTN|nr:hypothetical protein [Nocardioides donggukensis]MBD8868093.1 hypothetical protein [Nocardioides donggukensis]
MAATQDTGPTAARTEDAAVAARPWHRRRGLWLVLLSALVLGVAASGWVLAGARARSAVEIVPVREVRCEDSSVRVRRFAGRRIPTMAMRPGMRCRWRLSVENASFATVTVTEVILPFMGPGGGAAVRVRELDGEEPVLGPDGDGIDARFPVDHRLAPGADLLIDVEFRFRPRGCSGADLTTVWGFPTLTVDSLLTSGSVVADLGVGFRGTPEGTCDT